MSVFMKLGVYAVAFCVSAIVCMGRAAASPFCPADVAFVTPWDFEKDAPADGASSLHYAYRLKDDGTDVLSGHVVFASDSQTYTLAFDRMHFTDANRPASDPDPIGDEFVGDGAFVTLPANVPIRYAWVSDVTDAGGAVTNCPVFPFKVPALTAEDRARMTASAPPKGVHIMYNDRLAQAGAPLPPANCPDPYRDVAPEGAGPGYTQFYDPSITGKPQVEGAAAVDPSGKVVATAVLKSSGSQVYDNAAKEEYGVRKFRPALFDCRPAAGIYYFIQEYYYQK